MMDLEKIAASLDAAAASLMNAASAFREALPAEETPPPEPPIEPEPPPEPKPVVERLAPDRRIEDFEWPVEPSRIAKADGSVVVRQGHIAKGRFAVFGFPPPSGVLIPGAIQKHLITARISEPGDGRIELKISDEVFKVFFLTTEWADYELPWKWVEDDLGIDPADVQCRVEFLTDTAGRYEVDAIGWVAVHSGALPEEPTKDD